MPITFAEVANYTTYMDAELGRANVFHTLEFIHKNKTKEMLYVLKLTKGISYMYYTFSKDTRALVLLDWPRNEGRRRVRRASCRDHIREARLLLKRKQPLDEFDVNEKMPSPDRCSH